MFEKKVLNFKIKLESLHVHSLRKKKKKTLTNDKTKLASGVPQKSVRLSEKNNQSCSCPNNLPEFLL